MTTSKLTRCTKNSSVPPRYGHNLPSQLFVRKFSSDVENNPSSDLTSIAQGNDRKECAICKKYSQGPCGSLFTSWLNCIDASDPSSKSSACDDLILKLDKCLKENEKYYEDVDVYDDEEVVRNESRWKSFITELESDNDVKLKDFPSESEPEMQYRLKDKMGIIMFYPTYAKEGSKHILVLGYVKDQNGTILAGASSDELVEYEGMYMLRFRADKESRDIKACAVYMEADNDEIDDVIIYERIERIPV